MAEIPKNLQAEEWDPNKPMVPPEDTEIFRPFRELTTFYPNDQPDREDLAWVVPIEQRFLQPLGLAMARIFRVDLIDDLEYLSMPEEAKARVLSCCLTRAGTREVRTGVVEWNPLLVVAKYCIMVAVEVRVDLATSQTTIPKMLLWSRAQQEYVPVVDPVAGRIQNPGVLLTILERYARLEGLG